MSISKKLTYMGTLPFIACAILMAIGMNDLSAIHPFMPSTSMLAHSYGVIIVCFVVGMQWGLILPKTSHNDDETLKKHASRLLILTNIIALIAWISMMIPNAFIGIFICMMCFTSSLYLDYRCKKLSLICGHVFKHRIRVTSIVVISLLIVLFFL